MPQRRSLPGELRIPVPGLPVPNGRLPATEPGVMGVPMLSKTRISNVYNSTLEGKVGKTAAKFVLLAKFVAGQ